MPSVSLWAFLAENYFLLQISQPCGAGLFAFSQKKLLLVQRAVAWDRLHSFYKNHRRRGRSAGPEAGRGVSSPPSLPLDSTHPATRKGLLAPSDPKAVGLHTKNPSRSAKGFLCSADFESLARRAVRASLCSVCCANASAGSRRCKMPLPATTLSREN